MKAELFRTMPPKRHDRDLERSSVVQYIADRLDCDLETASKTFRYLRNKGHLVFTTRGRFWRGAEFVPDEPEAQRSARMQGEINALRIELNRLTDLVDKMREKHNELSDFVHGQSV